MKKLWIRILIFTLFIIPALTGCTGEKTGEVTSKKTDKNMETFTVVRGDINETVSASGIVTPGNDTVAVTPKIIGTVEKILFEENCRVKKGDVLVMLDQKELQNQIEQGEANLGAARIRVEQAETAAALQPEEIAGKIAQAESAWITAEKQVEQVKIQLKAQEEQLEAKIEQAKLSLEAAEDNLAQIEKQSPIVEDEVKSLTDQAESSFNTAKNSFERQENLYKQGFISKQDYELASNQYETAKTEYEMAKQKGETLKNQNLQALTAAENQVKQAEELLKQAELALEQQKKATVKQIGVAQSQADQTYVALENARALSSQTVLREQEAEGARENLRQLEIALKQLGDQLENTKIKTPVEGTVIKKMVTPGQTASPTMPVAVIANLDHLVIEALVDEGDIGKVKESQKVNISTDNFPEEIFPGEVIMVSSSASDVETIQNVATYKIVIEIEDDRGLLKMGMNTYNDVIVAEKKNVILVPSAALHQSEGKDIVYVMEGNSKKERPVETGLSDNENIEIVSGLSEGEKVVVVGLQ